ncbi:type II toxin-antitoxin system PemK/MazF family toxin [Lignipirellula cremea]|uniref:type II toxin-antitoxin system PemK/MazF family toxin n=1 Tax=Lignipirellula cremea TaxID=2528010 RepID=UPI00119FF23C|nr:type II toxin-antitoxin system PemK/MazF family toxin [Lignipirellula cremea]
MALQFHPGVGQLLYCDFDQGGFAPPEMVKTRPVVVMSRKNSSDICTVVPLSGTEPDPFEQHHHKMTQGSLPANLINKGEWWAKCDMVTTVAFRRLDRIRDGRHGDGSRKYYTGKISAADLESIKRGVLYALCMNDLISP